MSRILFQRGENMNWDKFLGDLVEALIPILIALLTALIGYAITFLKKKTELIKDEQLRNIIQRALDEANEVADQAVLATQQKFVDNIKKAREDGKLTKEEAKEAMDMAISYFKTHITDESLKILEELYIDVDKWLEDFLEAKLGQLKYVL